MASIAHNAGQASARKRKSMIRKSGYRFSLATNAKRLRGDHAQTKTIERDGDSTKSHLALVLILAVFGGTVRVQERRENPRVFEGSELHVGSDRNRSTAACGETLVQDPLRSGLDRDSPRCHGRLAIAPSRDQ